MNIDSLSQFDKTDEEIQEIIEQNQRDAMSVARMQAAKIYKKNKRELDRLNKLAQGAVLENNFPSYKYAIEKSRTILRQPFNDEIIIAGWQTTRKTIWNIINDHPKEV